MTDAEITDVIFEYLGVITPFTTAHEVSEWCNITPQKASGILRKIESQGLIASKKIKAGRNEVKIYFLEGII